MTLLVEVKQRHAVTWDITTISGIEIWNRGPTSDAEGDDPDGERRYEYRVDDKGTEHRGWVTHRRAAGALSLVQKVLADALGSP